MPRIIRRSTMATPLPVAGNFEGPIDIRAPELEEDISDLVRSFAEERGIKCEIFYHDEPVWFVSEQEGALVRSVQIGAFRAVSRGSASQETLFLIPDVCLIDEEKLEEFAISPEQTNKHTVSILLDDLWSMSSTGRREKLEELLREVWRSIKKFDRADLTHPLGTIPPGE